MMELPQSLKIEITEEDISKGRRCSCNLCPTALAVARLLPTRYRVEVGISFTNIVRTWGDQVKIIATYNNPDVLRDFIKTFDARLKAQPLTVVLEKWET